MSGTPRRGGLELRRSETEAVGVTDASHAHVRPPLVVVDFAVAGQSLTGYGTLVRVGRTGNAGTTISRSNSFERGVSFRNFRIPSAIPLARRSG